MKKLALCLALLGLLGLGGSAFAVQNTIDAVPAATLLLPYFEVDLAGDGINTLFSINNASATAVLAHVTVWSDWSVPVLDFDVYLTGYDVQSISMFDILGNGNLPYTASAGQDPKDTISPKGPVSQDINFASCANTLPYQNPAISPAFKAHLQAALKGLKSPATGRCYGEPYGDNIVRGYVTVDTVNACNLYFPSDWAFYSAFITNQNVLWGDYFYVNPTENFAQGDNLVHIEAFPQGFVPGDHTFYGRYNAATAADFREALPTTLAARYLNGGVFTGGTSLITWREGNSSAASVTCTTGRPTWYPLRVHPGGVLRRRGAGGREPAVPVGRPDVRLGDRGHRGRALERVGLRSAVRLRLGVLQHAAHGRHADLRRHLCSGLDDDGDGRERPLLGRLRGHPARQREHAEHDDHPGSLNRG